MFELIVIIICMALTFYFAGTETAFISVNRVRIELWRRQKSRSAEIAADFLRKPERFIYTTLVGNNIANVALASYATVYFDQYLGKSVTWLLVTVITVLFGEIIPKTLFRSLADWIIRKVAPLLKLFYYLLLPMIWVVSKISEFVLKMFHQTGEEIQEFFSKKDLEILFRESENRVNIDRQESEILGRVLHLRTLWVRDAMIPRTEIVAINEKSSLEELIRKFRKTGFTKIPVYRKNLDDIIGVVILKDLFTQPQNLQEIIREVMFVPDTKRSSDLLQEFRRKNTSIAIVINEYGGTAGLVTTEDIIEELVGEIEDEYDETTVLIRKVSDTVYSVNARIELEMLEEQLGISLPEGEYETLAGFLLKHFGHIPHKDEVLEFRKYRFVVTRASRRKIQWVRIIFPTTEK
ncbi:MAG TPA: HlyC/CorC family transporter [Caldithrix sp.]|nr:HlyC/CorC family transporter [Caldithrix sp.]